MLVVKWRGLVPKFCTRMHVCPFGYSTHFYGASSQGRRFSNVPKVDKFSNILSKSVNLRAGSGAASPGIKQILINYLFGRYVGRCARLETA